ARAALLLSAPSRLLCQGYPLRIGDDGLEGLVEFLAGRYVEEVPDAGLVWRGTVLEHAPRLACLVRRQRKPDRIDPDAVPFHVGADAFGIAAREVALIVVVFADVGIGRVELPVRHQDRDLRYLVRLRVRRPLAQAGVLDGRAPLRGEHVIGPLDRDGARRIAIGLEGVDRTQQRILVGRQ